ncbi:hypothetical protein P6F26_18795 [Roseibacterium sp. SDUM158017]|uniref:hypothetical protein n=1 Tax=Roseicyclus salinarum TaxID=3036773 RepID=UPI002414E8CA|nr:hypothetical protein [Roseibacterium sp. SDUM158017]MDG4650497.1 hypothetical protein [Roseibacterium sp. SDUM158017]
MTPPEALRAAGPVRPARDPGAPSGTLADALNRIDPRGAALFLGFEGALAEAEGPAGPIRAARGAGSLVALLEGATRGGTVVLSGLPVADLRRHLAPIPQCVLVDAGPGTGIGPAPHFSRDVPRARLPHSASGLHMLCCAISSVPPLPCGMSEGGTPGRRFAQAVEAVMGHVGMAGRRPILIGGEGHEAALDWVRREGGIAVRIGRGGTRAPFRLAGPAEVRAVLSAWLERAMGLA